MWDCQINNTETEFNVRHDLYCDLDEQSDFSYLKRTERKINPVLRCLDML